MKFPDTDDGNSGENHTNRMRKRFNELLDDTFSLFGSSTKEPELPVGARASTNPPTKLGNRGQSAVVRYFSTLTKLTDKKNIQIAGPLVIPPAGQSLAPKRRIPVAWLLLRVWSPLRGPGAVPRRRRS